MSTKEDVKVSKKSLKIDNVKQKKFRTNVEKKEVTFVTKPKETKNKVTLGWREAVMDSGWKWYSIMNKQCGLEKEMMLEHLKLAESQRSWTKVITVTLS